MSSHSLLSPTILSDLGSDMDMCHVVRGRGFTEAYPTPSRRSESTTWISKRSILGYTYNENVMSQSTFYVKPLNQRHIAYAIPAG